ncbi:hypothetical protein TcWFU_007213 [Taenia crassiceps]|uniref:Uncharacterized protein n=1 Tax=Taenia crassiceps TaxID=6207 RepID=A0ABR4Q171_9CEST
MCPIASSSLPLTQPSQSSSHAYSPLHRTTRHPPPAPRRKHCQLCHNGDATTEEEKMIVFKMYIASAATSGNECGDSSGSSGPQQGRVVRSLNHWTGDGWAAVHQHQHQQYLNATPHSSHLRLLGAGVLGHSLGALRHRVLGQLTRQQQTHSSLNLPACDCRLLVIMRQPARLSGNPLEDVVHEGVHYRHRLRRDARVRMHLTQHLVDVDGVALPPPPPPPPLLRLVSLRHLHLRRLLLRSFA